MRKIKPMKIKKMFELLFKAFGFIGLGISLILFIVFIQKTTYEMWLSEAERLNFDVTALVISAISVIMYLLGMILEFLNSK